MEKTMKRRIDALERRIGQYNHAEALKQFFDEALGDGKVSQETLDTGDPDGYFTTVFGLKKCDDGYWRMPSEAKESVANEAN